MNERTSYEVLLTSEVLEAVRPYAEKLAKRTHGALNAQELIQTAVEILLRRKRLTHVESMTRLLMRRVRFAYLIWVTGENQRRYKRVGKEPVPFSSPQDRYMATGPLPIHDGVKQLTTPNPAESWDTLLDIEQAIRTLNAEEQRLILWKYWMGMTNTEIAAKLGLPADAPGEKATQMAVVRLFHPIQEKLKHHLAAYE